MKSFKTKSGKALSKIGIGSYGIGGRGHRDMDITEKESDDLYIDALVYTLSKGVNFTEIALGYGRGQSLALFKAALDKSSIAREDVFVTHSLYPRDLDSMQVLKDDTTSFYRVMDTDYADSTLVTQSLLLKFGEQEVYDYLHEILDSGKTRYVSLSNASPNWIRRFKDEFGDNFFAHEGHLSFEVRALQDKGVFKTCDELGLKNIIWRPLGRSKTFEHNWELLIELAAKYQKTQGQIILNWMCNCGYSPMVFSRNNKHIDENVAATEFKMSSDDYERMNDFRPRGYNPPAVDWEGSNIDDDIVGLVKDFDGHLGKQL